MFRDTFRLRDWVSEMPANSTIKKKKNISLLSCDWWNHS